MLYDLVWCLRNKKREQMLPLEINSFQMVKLLS